ncbi:MAG: TonB-dependent receptor plug domain-containing protein [Bacteroidales bacterium]|nr:TonB-dependent receptor plug domain-containing protein [Bacteroidales bacterium]
MRNILFISFALFTGAIAAWAQEPADTLQDVRPFGTHALEMLTAREPGVEVISSPGAPGMTPTIHIRGLGVLPGIEPVYVVDGMRRRTLDGIAPESIEKIEVLKDAAAMGLWGPDAAAGVVVVTTRRASQKGFHAGYDFVGGVQRLSYVPERMTLADWQRYDPYRYSGTAYREPDPFFPESTFLQRHHLFAQYGGEKLSAYAGFSFLDNDGPYPGKVDTHRRYAASWSAEYRPVRWLSLETTGRWGQSAVSRGVTPWLPTYLVSRPIDTRREFSVTQFTDRTDFSETVVQGKLEIRPLPGLYVRGFGGFAGGKADPFYAYWEDYPSESYADRLTAKAGYEGKKWFQWGAEAGWSGTWRGHRLRVDGTFRRMKEKQDNHVIGGACDITEYGLTFGNDAQVVEKYLDPAYEKFLEAGGSIAGFEASGLTSIGVNTPETKWKEGVLSVGYDWKGRYEAGFSYYRAWEQKLFSSEGYRIPAVTLGWNLAEEPLLQRVLPAWWKDWSVKASWSKTDPYIPMLDASRWLMPRAGWVFNSASSTDARHRDLTSRLGFQWGKAALDLSASWFIHDDGLTGYYAGYYTGPDVENKLITGSKRYYDLRNRGVELSADLRGEAGALRYALSAYMTLYKNQVTFEDGLKGISYFSWYEGVPVCLKDGEPLGGRDVIPFDPETGHPSYADGYWTGSAFPSMTGGLRMALGWKHWQLTVSGHGDRGQTILHHDDYDALSRYYLEDYRTVNNPDGKYAIVDGPDFLRSPYSVLDASFFRIDQIRLDYAFPFRGVRLDLFASMENAFLFTRYPGTDPELALAWQGFGYESATYPSTRRVLFGVKVGF